MFGPRDPFKVQNNAQGAHFRKDHWTWAERKERRGPNKKVRKSQGASELGVGGGIGSGTRGGIRSGKR